MLAKKCTVAVLVLLLLPLGTIAAQKPEAVLRSAFLFGERPTSQLECRLEIHRAGDVKERGLVVQYEQEDGESRVLVRVESPFFLKGMKFLGIRPAEGEEQRWLATSRSLRNLGSGDDAQPVFDSDFTSEDLSGIDFAEYQFALTRTETLDDLETLVITAHSNVAGASWPKRMIWIDTRHSLVRRIDYYSAEGEVEKQYRLEKTMSVDGKEYPARVRMTDLQSGSESVLHIDEITLLDDIPDDTFKKENL